MVVKWWNLGEDLVKLRGSLGKIGSTNLWLKIGTFGAQWFGVRILGAPYSNNPFQIKGSHISKPPNLPLAYKQV